ncbi:MAG TPA: DUF4097 family beta strand repeat-containing protein [Terriglobales bacterium]|nr:DUF4097 family beta strand repeat-containing protein [Terriglobales bacterium]
MASPVINPRPARSIAGPVVLILVGVLFLLITMGVLDRISFVSLYGRYWPALLILWGVIKLAEHERAKRAGFPARGIGAGGVFLCFFIVVSGLSATQFVRVWPNIRDNIQLGDNGDWEDWAGGTAYNYSDELSKEFPAGGTLRINDERGTVNINVEDDSHTVKVSVRKKIRADRQSDADGYNTKTKPDLSVNDKIVTLNANTQAAGDKSIITDMDVYVPRNVELVITGRRGDVTVNGITGNASINHQHGDVTVSDHTGNVTIDIESSSARVSHVKGDVTIQGRGNEVAVEDIDGAAHLNGEFQESVRLVRITKTVSFKSARTDMEFARLDGRLDLDSGDLRADSLAGPMRLITRSKDISLDGLSGDLRLQDDNGTVEVGLHKPGNVQIENRKGDVQVTLAPNTAVRVEARSRGGEISSDFSELQINNGENQASATGSIGSNGPNLVINSEHGTVEIRRGNVAVAPPAPPAVPGAIGKPPKPGKALRSPKAPPVESEN